MRFGAVLTFAFTPAAALHAGRLFEGLAALVDREVDQAEGAQAVHQAEAGQLVDQAGSQQHQRHVDAHHGAVGVRQNGGGIQRAPDPAFGAHQRPHGGDGDQGDDQPRQGGFGLVCIEQVENRAHAQPDGQDVERRAGDAQGGLLELRARGVGVLADAQYHGQDARAGQHLNERVHPEAEQGQGLVRGAEVDGHQSFEDVIEDGDDGQPKGILPGFAGGIGHGHACFL